MSELSLRIMTRELCHTFYKHFENDPDIYMDMNRFAPYKYDERKVEDYFDAQQKSNRIVFMLMLGEFPIGEIKLKDIDRTKKECSLGIHLQNDLVKGKGYGTMGEKMAIKYAFDKLEMQAINADVVLKNTKSQHILEKLGFCYLRCDDTFKYYRLEKNNYYSTIDNSITPLNVKSSN